MSYIECYDEEENLIRRYRVPFDMEVNCCSVHVYGKNFSGMKLRGKCEWMSYHNVRDFIGVDLSGFMELEIGELMIGAKDKGLLKILELNCKKFWGYNKKLDEIMNKYLKESDPLMRDMEGFKLEMAVNGFGDRL